MSTLRDIAKNLQQQLQAAADLLEGNAVEGKLKLEGVALLNQ